MNRTSAAEEQRALFVAQALEARAEMIRTGKGYMASEAHEYIRQLTQGKKPLKPRAKPWRS